MSEIEERQELELSSVKAIYPELIDLRSERIKKNANINRKTNNKQNNWRPIEIQITIKPNSDDVYVQVDLYVKCSNKYPKELPIDISLKNASGLSSISIQTLEQQLHNLANELAAKDEEMLFLFINEVQNFLDENNKPGPKSFYDQMLSNNLKKQEEEEKLRIEELTIAKNKEKQLNKVLKEAMDEKQKLIETERKRRTSFLEDEITTSINSLENSISNLKKQFLSNLSLSKIYQKSIEPNNFRNCKIEHPLINCKFKTVANELYVQRYTCELHFNDNYVDYLALQDKKDLTPFFLSEWNFNINNFEKVFNKEETSKIMKELSLIKTTFEHNLPLLNHQHILQPIAFSFSLDNNLITLRLLQNYIFNIRFCDMPYILNIAQPELKSIGYYFIQILDGLNYLHRNHLSHGDLNTENILINLQNGQIKISNSTIQKLVKDFQEKLLNNNKLSVLADTKINFQFKDLESDYYNFALLIIWFLYEFKFTFTQLVLMKRTDIIKMINDLNLDECTINLIKNCLNGSSITILEPLFIDFFSLSLKQLSYNSNHEKKYKDEDNSFINNNQSINFAITNKNSRLSDYIILSKLGKGGFGDVWKVKNILDQNEYALKKIKINTSNKLLNKKIKQEVRYLSGLNHENVVRYFGAWVEYEMKNEHKSNLDEDCLDNSNLLSSFDGDEEDDDELSDDENLFSTSFNISKANVDNNSDDYVIFEESSNNKDIKIEEPSVKPKQPKKKISTSILPYNEIMYIQMELCEKSTLQNAIQNEQLYLDNKRKKRLFRELIEGLAHIHEKEIIHRDLKPGNIFLDVYDHVKIGDFGLATNEIIRVETQQLSIQNLSNPNLLNINLNVPQINSTPQTITINKESEIVGTPFYLSPEILAKSNSINTKKISYTQKVDIYSVGVIFFEMCYPSPSTGMERYKVLTNLRLPEIIFPEDVDKYLSEQEKKLTKLLLNHIPEERPSSNELLQSEYLPPLEIEEEKQQNMIKSIVQNSRSKQFKFLLNTLFNKPMTSVDDIVYDSEIDVFKSKKLINNEQLKLRVFQFVSDRLSIIFKKYGAIRFTVSTFTPAHSLNKFNLNHAFNVIDNNGTIIIPPYDLRIPFARFIARNQNYNIPAFKRYAIDKVYRSRTIGYHPRELWECAFDIITTQTGTNWQILPDVEIFLILNEIIDSFDCLKNKPFTLRINSVKFLKAVFTYFEIDEKKIDEVLRVFAETNDRNFVLRNNEGEYFKSSKDHIVYMLTKKEILETNKIINLIQMLEGEKNNSKEMIELIKSYMRRKSHPKQQKAYEEAVDAIKELGLIIDCLQNSSSTLRMKVKYIPNLVLNSSNCNIYSNLIFQLQYDIAKKHQVYKYILATGGRYDKLIQDFSVNFSSQTDPMNEKALISCEQQTGVGMSLEVEKIIKHIIEDDNQLDLEETSNCDLAIYTEIYDDENFRFIYKDLCQIGNELRQHGYRVKVFTEKFVKSLSDLNRYCFDNLIKYLFILIKPGDQQIRSLYYLKTLIFDKEKFLDKRSHSLMNCLDIIEYIKNEVVILNQSSCSSQNSSNSFCVNQISNNFSFESTYLSSNFTSCSSNSNFISNTYTNTNVKYTDVSIKVAAATNVQFIFVEKTFDTLSKKKVLSLISSSISNKLNHFVNSSIEVLALEIPFKFLKLIAFECDLEKDSFGNIDATLCELNIKRIVEKCPKFKNHISEVMYKILDLKRKRDTPVIILISVNEIHDLKFVIVP